MVSEIRLEIGPLLHLLPGFCSAITLCIRKVIKSYLENIGLAEVLIKSIIGMVRDCSRTNYIWKNERCLWGCSAKL